MSRPRGRPPKTPLGPPTDTGRCGTITGGNRHYRNREQPCADCRRALNRHYTPYPTKKNPPDCGTISGAKHHRRIKGEPPCEDCREAERAYDRRRYRPARQQKPAH